MRKSLWIIPPIVVLALAQLTLAQGAGAGSGAICSVTVRMLSAREQPRGPLSAPVQMTSMIDDMHDQLRVLPYRAYEPITLREQHVAWGAAAEFELNRTSQGKHTLVVTPHEFVGKRVAITVEWRDASSKELVSTKLRVRNGENVVLGSDKIEDKPVIVAIRVSC